MRECLKNATPIPESLKTALQQPQEKPTEKQSETIKPGNNNGGGFQAHPELINKEGRPKRKTITEYIIDELNKELPSGINGHQNMARLVLQMAFGRRDKNGKILARPDKELIKETWHYLDGMPTQKTQLTGDDDGPLQVEIIEHKEKKDES